MNSAAPAQPFFLGNGAGQRFCLFHPAAGAALGMVLYVHPFGDEMNKARRMAALQARALAARGYGVLQIDLHGCGDSAGAFSEARWDSWKEDLGLACAWLAERAAVPLTLFGLRLGGLLALDYARTAAHPVARMVLWQPVQSGAAYLTQYLRLLSANAMLAGAGGPSTAELRASLLGGQMLEVAGYELAPALAAAIDKVELAPLAPACPVSWFEAVSAPERPLPPAVERLAGRWREQGVALDLQRIVCAPFWSTQEIEESPELLAATTAVFSLPTASDEHALSRASA